MSILPKRFVKIRHYGLLQNHGKITRLNSIRQQLKLPPLPPNVQVPVSVRMLEKYGKDITLCPKYNRGKLVLIHINYGDHATPVSKNLELITGKKYLHHHKKLQGLSKYEKVLINDKKMELLLRVREGVATDKKKGCQPTVIITFFKNTTAQNKVPSLLYHL